MAPLSLTSVFPEADMEMKYYKSGVYSLQLSIMLSDNCG